MSNTFSPFTGLANFAMAATPLFAVLVAVLTNFAHKDLLRGIDRGAGSALPLTGEHRS